MIKMFLSPPFGAVFAAFADMGRILCLVGCLMYALCGRAQGRGQDVVQMVLERVVAEMEGEGAGEELLEGVAAHYGRLLEHPLDINGAGRRELENMYLLSDFQIESILEYRRVSGNILSATELSLLHGFSSSDVKLLEPFIVFGNGSAPWKTDGRSGVSELLLKWWWKEPDENYLGPPFYSQIKYRWELPQKLQAGFMLEKDSGERVTGKGQVPLGDFASFHLMAQDVGIGRGWSVANAVLGDYTIRLGQGLAVWNTFSLQGATSWQGIYKRGAAVAPYTSSDENRFFRGAASSVRKNYRDFKELEITAFWSLKNVDARVKDGKYTSLPKDGLHNTESLLQTRKKLGELVYGASCAYRNKWLKVGANYIGYGYNAHNGRKVQEYNRYSVYDGQYGNFSVDAAAVSGKGRFFAEFAMDYGGAAAILLGLSTKLGKWESTLALRNYPKGYIAPYAGAFSSLGECSNQRGIAAVVQNSSGKVKLQGGVEYTFYPWKRYNVDRPSGEYRFWWRMERVTGESGWNIKLYNNCYTYGTGVKCGAKGMYGMGLSRWLHFKLRGEFVALDFSSTGAAIGTDLILNMLAGKLKLVAGGAWYNCREWESRLYMYEYDLPSSYMSSLLYGKGFKWYALVNADIGKWCSIHIKGDSKYKIKLGLKLRFF